MYGKCLCLIVLLWVPTHRAYAQDCSELIQPINDILQRMTISKPLKTVKLPTEAQLASDTEEVHKFVEKALLDRLAEPEPSKKMESFLTCLQSRREYDNFRGESNTPLILLLDQNTAVVSYIIYRGGLAIPDWMPFVDLYMNAGSSWHFAASVGAAFRASTFFIQPLQSGKKGEKWFLATGFKIGDTGTRLRLEVFALGKEGLQSIWSKGGLRRTQIKEVSGGNVYLTQDAGFENGHDVTREIRFKVISSGLRDELPRPADTHQ